VTTTPGGPTPPPAGSSFSTAMLDDLLTNTLDPGYRAAAKRASTRHWWDGPMVWIGCIAVGLLLITAYQQSHRSAPAREAARKDLISRIRVLQSAGTSTDAQAKQLASQVAGLRDAQLSGTDSRQLRQLEIASGAIAVSGPGIEVTVGEPKAIPSSSPNGRPGTGAQQNVAVLHDRDIRSVVNQLWLSGAEAIAINGIRLTATSAIRFAGESILVDFQTLSSPYTISAIGDRNSLLLGFADSAIARQLKTTEAVYGISFTFTGKSKVQLPSVTVGQQNYASPGASGSPTPHPSETSR
jgi:uncharacterized protein YlxW (UPF0749 family)